MKFEYSDLCDLRNNYGDSFYLLDIKKFESNFSDFYNAFKANYPKVNIGYSYKTNYTPAICKRVNSLGGLAEVVSEMEYELALKVGVTPENIIVNGPYKTPEALERYLSNGSLVNLDSYKEFEELIRLAEGKPAANFRVGFRCNFDIDNSIISRFGFDVYSPRFRDMLNDLEAFSNINLESYHCHFPDRNLDSYSNRVKEMLKLISSLQSKPPKFIDIGGGFFGKMDPSLAQQFGKVHSYLDYASLIGAELSKYFSKFDEDEWPTLILEPGSALVADTTQFVCSVVDVKNIRGQDIAITSGSKFNIGLLTSSVQMPYEVFNEDEASSYESLDISGYTCIESDYLARNYKGKCSIGAFVLISNVGSYSVVFKPPFIHPNVPMIVKDDDNGVSVVKRCENMEDIFSTFSFEGC